MLEANNQFGNFNPSAPSGLVQQTSGNALFNTDNHAIGPRLGVVWDVTGKGTTVVRAGGSVVFNDAPELQSIMAPQSGFLSAMPTGVPLYNVAGVNQNNPAAGNIVLSQVSFSFGQIPWVCNKTSTNCPGAPATIAPLYNPTAACGPGEATAVTPTGFTSDPSPCSIQPRQVTYKAPYVTNWTLAIQHAFTNNLSVNIAYVGAHGTDLPMLLDINQPTPGPGAKNAAAEQLRRPYYAGNPLDPGGSAFPFFSTIKYYGQGGSSNYNALQATVTQRVSHGVSFTFGYTYAHALSINESDVAAGPMNTYNPRQDYGNNANTPFHHASLTATWSSRQGRDLGRCLKGGRSIITLAMWAPSPLIRRVRMTSPALAMENAGPWSGIQTTSFSEALGRFLVTASKAALSRTRGLAARQTSFRQGRCSEPLPT